MKKLVMLSVIALGGLGFSYAQEVTTPQMAEEVGDSPVQQGNWIVGGSIGALGYGFESESFNLNVNPRAGYFIADGIAIGLGVNGGIVAGDHKPQWNYGVRPFVRYYFPEGASSIGRFFAQGDVGIDGQEADGSSDSSFAFGVNGGYAHFISNTVALEATLGYNYSKANISGAEKQSGLGIALGFQIYLPGNR